MPTKKQKGLLIIVFGIMVLSGCHMPSKGIQEPPSFQELYSQIQSTLSPLDEIENILTTNTPQQSTEPSASEVPEDRLLRVYIQDGLPEKLLDSLDENQITRTDDRTDADIRILAGPVDKAENTSNSSEWIYVLAAPFYTITDNISFENLQALWQGEHNSLNGFSKILVTESTKSIMSTFLGAADQNNVVVVMPKDINTIALSDDPTLFILPFDDLNKYMKVIRIDGQAPINSDFDPQAYPLLLAIWIDSSLTDYEFVLPISNYDPNLQTVLIMTGVTALTRATAHRMEINGNQFPGKDIRDWLISADLTHISNEVPFASNCPSPDPNQVDLIFCSSPERIELLEYVGADIIELTGNHLLDYGLTSINLTLEMYEERNWHFYAGGWDLADAQSPALITHNNNPLAFIGCNPVGPPNVWATNTKQGAAPCGDFLWMVEEIGRLKEEGYLPIVTMQYAEDYTDYPSGQMVSDFEMLADAGAIVVNGSQAHTPKMMDFKGESFLHYGLGNLFFDQMEVYYNDVYLPGTREEFIDRLFFYDGELISIELLTAILEDYARPRPMTEAERASFLSRIFSTAIDFRK